jgi:hypothetical protein
VPEFIITMTTSYGYSGHRCANNERHARRVLGGLKGRYPSATFRVVRVTGTEDVTGDFEKRG